MPRLSSALLSSLKLSTLILCILIFSTLVGPMAQGQNGRAVLITQNVDESKLATLAGNTRPEANKENDRGLVAGNLVMEHMLLQLKRSPEQEQELRQYIEEQEDRSSPNFHHWLTSKEYGERFGLATQDLDVITRWLASHGFKVNVVYENGTLIDFSGTAGQVRSAFHTEIHQLDVKGVKHFANMSDPRIPAALAPAVVGVVSLHDFKPHTNYKPRSNYTTGTGFYLVAPADLATIYNLNPLFTASISGQGQTVVVVEDTDVFTTADWTTFRSTFGLSSFTGGSFKQVHPAPPSGTNNCTDPGVNGDDGEAILDAEYASAAAPSATIELVSCSNTATFGGLIAIQNLLNESSTPPAIMSMSYGECEAGNGATSNAAFNSAFQQAVTEGVSVFVSSGDEGAASCDPNQLNATHGIGVSGWASTPYNVAVGGTDYGDTYAGTNSTYWSANNSPTYESALSYVPEIPWNDSCGSLLGALFSGFSQTYGSSGFCNNSTNQTTASGSGGPSGCATGTPSVPGVVGGTCAGWSKPSWQSLVGNPSDTVRDVPDVSLFAANGIWGHYYPFCYSDPAPGNGGAPCTGTPDNWSGGGGTSFSSPIMAGIQALVNQKTGARQGNPNPVYYSLAATEYGASGNAACNSTLGNTTGSSCIFYDVTLGDMDVNCKGTHNCYLPSGTYGVLSTSDSSYLPAYGTTTGWDFATGIGTVNAANLVNNWPSALSATTTTLISSPNPANFGVLVTFTATVTTTGSTAPTGTVTFNDGTTAIGTGALSTVGGFQVATFTTSTLTVGTHSITAVYGGDTNNAGGTSAVLSEVIVTPTFTFVSTPGTATSHTVLSGQTTLTYSFTATPTSASTFASAVNIMCSFSPADPTLTSSICSYSVNGGAAQSGTATIPAGSGTSTVTMTVKTAGPNSGSGTQLRHRSDNRLPWLPLTLPLAGVVMVGLTRRKMSRGATVTGMCLMLVLAGFLIACGSSSPPVSITSVTGSASSIFPQNTNWTNATATFTAVLANDSGNKGVTWAVTTANGGTIVTADPTHGTYTPPTIAAGLPTNVTITATAVADTSKTGNASIALNPTTVPGTYKVTVTAAEAGAASQTPNVTLVDQ
jgi:subtilase family serine protease